MCLNMRRNITRICDKSVISTSRVDVPTLSRNGDRYNLFVRVSCKNSQNPI